MSENSEKGRRGELAANAIFSNIGVYEPRIEVIRANTTSTPENGVDIAVKCPHNFSAKMDEIIQNGSSSMALANTQIDVRVQVKNYSSPINKATMQGFVDDIPKNPTFGEHWGIGGKYLTKGAKDVLREANKTAPAKWYTAEDFEKVQSQYPALPFTTINEKEPKE